MNDILDPTVYRLHRFSRRDNLPPKYQVSVELLDDTTSQSMAGCDLCGRATFTTISITDHLGRTWTLRPNRTVLPTRWILADRDQRIAMQFDQNLAGKLVNPIHKAALLILDGNGQEIFRLVDPRTSITDRVLGVKPGEWLLLAGETPVAKLTDLPSRSIHQKGILGRISSFFDSADRGYLAASPSPLRAQEVLAMMLLMADLTINH